MIDHIYPFNKGGADDVRNLTVQCKTCRKWLTLPDCAGWRDPVRFRGRKVKPPIRFVNEGGFFYPVFEFEDEPPS